MYRKVYISKKWFYQKYIIEKKSARCIAKILKLDHGTILSWLKKYNIPRYSRFIDLTGQKFGRLTVIKREYPNNKWGRARWLCKCNCGKDKIIAGEQLRQGKTQSCGCLKLELSRLDFGLAQMNRSIYNYKSHAKQRGLKYELTEDQFKKITKRGCFYCGAKPGNGINSKRIKKTYGDYIYNGIDRVNNKKGYTIDNVVACCKYCNRAKGTFTVPEFKAWIEKVYNKMFLKEVII